VRILFDHCTPLPIRRLLPGHEVESAYRMGWTDLDNGRPLSVAEKTFDLFLTVDTNIRYQQNLQGRRIAVLVIPQDADLVERHGSEFLAAVNGMQSGEFRALS
jgi:hypothetical protein